MSSERSPGVKLVLIGLVAGVLIVPLMMVYLLVYDRESESARAQTQIAAGWGGPQVVTGPLLVVPYRTESRATETDADGKQRTVTREVERQLFISPLRQSLKTDIAPDRKGYAIYESVVYEAQFNGTATFQLTEELAQLDVAKEDLILDRAQLRFGVTDPRGLLDGTKVTANGETLNLMPGSGPAATGGKGYSTPLEWTDGERLDVTWTFGLRGSQSLGMVPRGGETSWSINSAWPHPSFTGGFLPSTREISDEGFDATYAGISNLALGRGLMALSDDVEEQVQYKDSFSLSSAPESVAPVAVIGLVDPVDLYSQVDRAVKYGFLFIAFTFGLYFLFDVVGCARVAMAEYLLTGVGLVQFFVMLLAFAEIVGFGWAYVIAAAAIIGLLTAYSAAVLGTWKRAGFMALMLTGLYGVLYVLLNAETYSLVSGSLLLFAALAAIMYGTRRIDWAKVRPAPDGEGFAPAAT